MDHRTGSIIMLDALPTSFQVIFSEPPIVEIDCSIKDKTAEFLLSPIFRDSPIM